MRICAALAGPVSLAKVSVHFSFVPLKVPLNKPCADAFFATCAGTSCPDDSAAVQTVVRVAAGETAANARTEPAPAASKISFFTISFLGDLHLRRPAA
jgi:hypothetical protein